MARPSPLLLVAGGGVLGLLALAFTSDEVKAGVSLTVATVKGWVMRAVDVLRAVSKHEGTYTSINRNTDGAGASYGIIQWTQMSGNLGRLLAAMHAQDPAAFDAATEGRGAALLEATSTPGIRQADGLDVWGSTWARRLVALGNVPRFRAVQEEMALQGEHWQGAEAVARTLGVRTGRAMALFYDTAVQQGSAAARSIADKLRAWVDKQSAPVPYKQLLASYAWMCSARFCSSRDPGTHPLAPRLQWRAVGSEWHVFADRLDLYADVKRRREGILADTKLSDEPLVA